jgi:hypothetical protein
LLHDYIAQDGKPATQKNLRRLVKEAVANRGAPDSREKVLKRIPSK